MLKCRQVPEQAERMLAGDLTWRERLSLRMHLFICGHCRRYVRQLALLLRSVPFLYGPASDDDVDKVIKRVHCEQDSHQH